MRFRLIPALALMVVFLLSPADFVLSAPRAKRVEPGEGPLTFAGAIRYALEHHPSLQAAVARVYSAQSGTDLARTAYLPRANVGLQGVQGSFNNVPGSRFMESFSFPITGRALGRDSLEGGWTSTTGLLLAWEPFDFGLRDARVRSSEASRKQASAEVVLTQLEVAVGVGDAFLELLLAVENERALKANVERRQVFADAVGVLVKNGLRPGADESRAIAELVAARTELIRAGQAKEVARANLAEMMGRAGEHIEIVPGPLLHLPNVKVIEKKSPDEHPLAKTQEAAIQLFRSRKEALDSAWAPKFDLQAGTFGRGSGWWDAAIDRDRSIANGLAPDTFNWAVGATVTFPLSDYFSNRAERNIEAYHIREEKARYDKLMQELKGKSAKAHAVLEGAVRIAENTPQQLKATRDLSVQSRARYQAGLGTIVEVADSDRLLIQATVEDVLARLKTWHALLGAAHAMGDIRPLLDLVAAQEGKDD